MDDVCLRDPVSVDPSPTNSVVLIGSQQRSQSRAEIVLAWVPFYNNYARLCGTCYWNHVAIGHESHASRDRNNNNITTINNDIIVIIIIL